MINRLAICLIISLSPLAAVAQQSWPPDWLEGAWLVTSTEATVNGTEPEFKIVHTDAFLLSQERSYFFKAAAIIPIRFVAEDSYGGAKYVLFEIKEVERSLRVKFEQVNDPGADVDVN